MDLNITEVRLVLPTESVTETRLLAYASITLASALVIRDVRLINGRDRPFLAMPTRIRHQHCPSCSQKNGVTFKFCSNCGRPFPPFKPDPDKDIHIDVVHPISSAARTQLESYVVSAYEQRVQTKVVRP